MEESIVAWAVEESIVAWEMKGYFFSLVMREKVGGNMFPRNNKMAVCFQ